MVNSEALKDSREDLARAREELDSLRAAITAHAESKPFEIVDTVETEPDGTNAFVGRFKITPTPFGVRDPFRSWGQDVRNIGVHIRAALDYLVFQLGMQDRHGGLKPDDKGAATNFPICLTPRNFQRREKDLLRGVNSQHRAMIERLQPYHRGSFQAAVNDPLVVLASITNPAKHRFPNAAIISDVVITKNGFDISWEGFGPDPEFQLITPKRFVVQNGTEAYRMRVAGPKDMKVTVRRITTDMGGEIAFGPQHITVPRIEVVHKHVVGIIDSFETVFPA